MRITVIWPEAVVGSTYWCAGRLPVYMAGFAGAAVLDAATPLCVADWLIDLALGWVAATWGGRLEMTAVGAGATACMLAGLWSSPHGAVEFSTAAWNRVAAIAVLWAIVYVSRSRSAAGEGQKPAHSLLAICSVCKRIRGKADDWYTVEAYVGRQFETRFTHTYCPLCAEQAYAQVQRATSGE